MTAIRREKSALDWLRDRRQKDGSRLISDIEYQAGDRIRQDFWRARMMPSVTTNYSAALTGGRAASGGGGAMEFRQGVLDARERVRRALVAVGNDYAGLLVDICCLDRKLTDVELEAGWPKRSGKVILQLALRQLARHYGILRERTADMNRADQIRHWGDTGYRPVSSMGGDEASHQASHQDSPLDDHLAGHKD